MPPSRLSSKRIVADLREAARRGDRTMLALALDQMRTLAHTPRYWEKYLELLRHPLARLVDLLVIKQGDRIAHQKGWKLSRSAPARRKETKATKAARPPRRRRADTADDQPLLFDV